MSEKPAMNRCGTASSRLLKNPTKGSTAKPRFDLLRAEVTDARSGHEASDHAERADAGAAGGAVSPPPRPGGGRRAPAPRSVLSVSPGVQCWPPAAEAPPP